MLQTAGVRRVTNRWRTQILPGGLYAFILVSGSLLMVCTIPRLQSTSRSSPISSTTLHPQPVVLHLPATSTSTSSIDSPSRAPPPSPFIRPHPKRSPSPSPSPSSSPSSSSPHRDSLTTVAPPRATHIQRLPAPTRTAGVTAASLLGYHEPTRSDVT